jgi:NAD(P)-dependent dehydrogenase (short-subunit alcohol dehydrogenase family)
MSDKGQQVAITTGGSQGIGASLITAYRSQDRSVVATARTMTPTEDPDVLTVDGDLADPATANRIVSGALGRFDASTRSPTTPASTSPSARSIAR